MFKSFENTFRSIKRHKRRFSRNQPIMKKLFFAILIIVSALFLAGLAVDVLLTHYITSVLIPRTADQYGIDRASIDILKPGLFETVAGQVRLGDRKTDFLEIASIKICYTPVGLINRHIETVIVNGLVVNAVWSDNSLVLPGFSPPARVEEDKDDVSDGTWPVTIGMVAVNNVMINVALGEDIFQLPVSLNMVSDNSNMQLIDGTLRLYPRGQEVTVNFRMDITGNSISSRLEAPHIRLGSLADWIDRLGVTDADGLAALSARADLKIAPPELLAAGFDLDLTRGGIAFQDVALGPVDDQTPISISVAGSTKKGWQVTGSAMTVSGPFPLRLSGFDGFLSAATVNGKRQGNFSVAFDRSIRATPSDFGLMVPINVDGAIDMENTDDSWRIALSGQQSAPDSAVCQFKSGDVVFRAPVPGFTLSAEGSGPQTRVKTAVELSQADMDAGGEKIALSNAAIRVEADITRSTDNNPAVSGSLRLSSGKISAVGQQAEIKKIEIDLPFCWPGSSPDRGGLAVGPLVWRDKDLGALTGTLQQKGKRVEISGMYKPGLVPGLKGDLSGTLGMDEIDPAVDMTFHLRHPADAAGIDLGRFLPQAAGTVVTGGLDAIVEIAMANGLPAGRLTSRIDNGNVRSAEKGFDISGIKADLKIPDLLSLKSDPDQKLSFNMATLGDIQVTDGEFEFQLESTRTVFLEKSGFKWCRGSVYAEGMRISPDRDVYDLTLYSDRLNLADVLSQIGGIQAEGEGTVSGRIPIRYAGGGISINNGFLFSAPGEGGIIYLSKTDILTAGLPKNSPQYTQIDLAREALKNYQYDWAKVLLNSEDENLLIRLSFDGKPRQSLPFIPDKKKGGFVRVENGRNGSEFMGLSLDVNFRIPLNELIGYKRVLNM